MLIQCTKKLLDELKLKPESHIEEQPLLSWHANLVRINRRKTVVLTNDQNRYIIVLYGLKAKDFRNFDELLTCAIRETFRYEQISDRVIEEYLGSSPGISYGKTKNRSMTGRLRSACSVAEMYACYFVEGTICQAAISAGCSTDLVWHEPTQEYLRPNEEMYSDLAVLAGAPIFDCRAVQVKITLELEKYNVWRRLVVPVDYTFAEFHKIIQRAFGWKDYHLHEFFVFDHRRKTYRFQGPNHPASHPEGYDPIIQLVGDEQSLDYQEDIPMELDHTVKLAEYVYKYNSMKYVYDFGDDWRHTIEVEKTLFIDDKNYPVCIDGEGKTPPEDVGGAYAYEEFLCVIEDKDAPDREYMMTWAESQGYAEFDIDMVNRRLRFFARELSFAPQIS